MTSSAIIGFGLCVPSRKITVEEIANAWHQDANQYKTGLGVSEKTVPGNDEDTFTLAFEAGKQAIEIAKIEPTQISAVFVGSESHPYAVKPTSGMVAQALTCDPYCHAADLEFACKAGTAAMQIVDSMVRSGQVEYGLAIGADCAQSKPGDALEYTAAAGAAAFVIGSANSKNALCRIEKTLSFLQTHPTSGEQTARSTQVMQDALPESLRTSTMFAKRPKAFLKSPRPKSKTSTTSSFTCQTASSLAG